MRTNMYPHIHAQGWPEHAAAWALDREGMDRAQPVRLTMLRESDAPGPQWPQRDDLWLWFGAETDTQGDLAACLSEAELERAGRFRLPQDTWSYMAAHAGLRRLLARPLGEIPRSIRFHALPGGKPALCPLRYTARRATALQFSISHSRGLVAVALSGSPVGVDVERVRPLPDMEQLIARFMAPETLAAFRALTDPQDRIALFYRNWTLGEAWAKATGEGIGEGFASLAFTRSGPPRLTMTPPELGPPERWHLGHSAATGTGKQAQAA